MSKILVTGGCGYIGAHTLVDLIDHGFEVISIDDLSNSDGSQIEGIAKITGVQVTNYLVDLKDLAALRNVFTKEKDIAGIIHFAAFKSVPESVSEPLKYFYNNICI